MTHTPGPWRIGGRDSVVCDTEIPQFQTAGSVDAYGGHLVAESIARENLAIISAAPEMLAALEMVAEWAEHTGNDSADAKDAVERLTMCKAFARAAISKARGNP